MKFDTIDDVSYVKHAEKHSSSSYDIEMDGEASSKDFIVNAK